MREVEVAVPAGGRSLEGTLVAPSDALGVVLFAHGSGSSRHSPRNASVARTLNASGIATLLFDLLDEREALDRTNVFDIGLLGSRLVDAARFVGSRPETRGLPLGAFGASTGGGAALWAAAELGDGMAAVVSRGGRPDLAGERLPEVRSPTLLIVGGRDDVVIDLNREAAERMRCPVEELIVPGATHLFEERGALEAVAGAAARWFRRWLASEPARRSAGA